MDEFKNANANGEFLNGAPDDNTMKVDFNNIESTESGIALEERFGVVQEYEEAPSVPVAQENVEYVGQPAPVQEMPVQPQIPVQPMPVQQAPVANKPAKKSKKAVDSEVKKAKKAKRQKGLGVFVRVFIISILSVATLWLAMYTIDHVLAAQGASPIMAISSDKYEIAYLVDENTILESNNQEKMYAYNYECLGYKVQLLFDEECNPKFDFVWAWEDGAIDELYNRGELFKEASE